MIDKKKVIKEIMSFTFSILGAFFIAILFSSNVFAKVKVQQSSMENTLYSNQQLIVDKLSYKFTAPKRGDIIIFFENEKKGTIVDEALRFIDSIKSIINKADKSLTDKNYRLVKRVIGIKGDEVNIKDGYIYLNGEKLDEPYVKGETFCGEIEFPIKVGENKLFVLGDNRPVSKDSREFGLIDYKKVDGKAIFRVYPFNKIGAIK